ncbi:MAG: PD40 domain-containing protein [Deltaproteobacteria bacterium]|nr:PD40 domain-containing protein [Deltaproteobacteria bacterium]
MIPRLLLVPAALAALGAAPVEVSSRNSGEVASRDGANLQRPRWSPDGSQLSYEANFHEKKVVELFVGDPATKAFSRVSAGGRAPSALTAGFQTAPTNAVCHELAWGPASAGGRFVYTAATETGDYDLFLSGAGALASTPGADGGGAWSPDGRWIAFTSSRTGEGDLYLLDTAAMEQPPRRISSAAGSSEVYAAWAPDSAGLAYVAHSRSGDNLWLKASLDANPAQLTTWPGIQIRPRWAPSGKRIAFYANHESPDRIDLYVVDGVAGATPKLLVKSVVPDLAGPSWTPDGLRLIVVRDADDLLDPIASVDAATGATKDLALDTVGHTDLDVVKRPDGKVWLAYVAQGRKSGSERDFQRLYTVTVD